MKHWLCALLILAMALSLCACEKKPQEEHREDPAAVRQEDSKLPPQDSPWGGSVPVDKTFERIAGAAEARLTSGQELLLLDFMDRYYRTLQDLRQVDIRDLCASAEEAAFQHCVWNSICTIRGAALEDLTLRGYSFDLAVKSVDRQDDDHLTVTVLENNVQYFTALGDIPSEQWAVKHVFDIERLIGDRWVIAHHISDDNPYYNFDYDRENDKDRNLDKLRSILRQRQESRLETDRESEPAFDHAYDRQAAREYMMTFAAARSSRFLAFDDSGGNCMNYGSQVLMAGGIPADKSGAKEQCWYNNGGYDLAVSFINVGGFLDYAAANTGAGLVARVGAAYYTGQVGDILTMGIDNPRSHTTVICDTVTDADGQVIDFLLCSNTANLRNFPAGAYYYTNQQVTKIFGWND